MRHSNLYSYVRTLKNARSRLRAHYWAAKLQKKSHICKHCWTFFSKNAIFMCKIGEKYVSMAKKYG